MQPVRSRQPHQDAAKQRLFPHGYVASCPILSMSFCKNNMPLSTRRVTGSDRLTWRLVQQVKAKLHHMFVLSKEGPHHFFQALALNGTPTTDLTRSQTHDLWRHGRCDGEKSDELVARAWFLISKSARVAPADSQGQLDKVCPSDSDRC